MRSEDLIERLSAEVRPADSMRWPRLAIFWLSLSAGLAGLLVVFGLSLRPDIGNWLSNSAMQIKSAYTLGLSLASLLAFWALSQPLGQNRLGPLFAIGLMMLTGTIALIEAQHLTPEALNHVWMAPSWAFCMGTIWALSAPILVVALWLMRQRAPVYPTQAGLASGLLAGALAASAYTLHCTEDSALFLFSWYTLGMALCGLTGAIAGHFTLRWRV